MKLGEVSRELKVRGVLVEGRKGEEDEGDGGSGEEEGQAGGERGTWRLYTNAYPRMV